MDIDQVDVHKIQFMFMYVMKRAKISVLCFIRHMWGYMVGIIEKMLKKTFKGQKSLYVGQSCSRKTCK